MADPTLTLQEAFFLFFGQEATSNEAIMAFVKAFNATADTIGLSRITFDKDDGWIVPDEVEALASVQYEVEGPVKTFLQAITDRFFGLFQDSFQSEMKAPKPPGVSKAEAKAVYRQHLRDLGVWNAKNRDWSNELDQRFEDMWEEYIAQVATGEQEPYPNPSEFHADLLEGVTPETEKEFMAKFNEEQVYKEDFNEAFDRLLAQGGIQVPPELLNAVKALVGKQFVDAAYRGSAGTPQGFIMGSTVDAVAKAQAQKEVGIKEDLLTQLVTTGDYTRASRLVGSPPSPAAEGQAAPPQATPSTSTETLESPEGRGLATQQQEKAGERAVALKSIPAAPFAGGRVLPEEKYGQFDEFTTALAKQTDPGFRKYVQGLLGTDAESPGFRQIRQGFQESGQEYQKPFVESARRAQTGGSLSQEETERVINPETGSLKQAPQQSFADFVGKEFERLRTDYERPALAQRDILGEESKARSARAKIRTVYR